MKTDEGVSYCASALLQPRKGLAWEEDAAPRPKWSKPFIIENKITQSIAQTFLTEEIETRKVLRDQIEAELSVFRAETNRFWMAEYRYLEKLLSMSQLISYAPGFLILTRIMPRKQVYCRRIVMRKYFSLLEIPGNQFTRKLGNHFIRSSVLLFPAEKLFSAAGKFANMVIRSADQSVKANRLRVVMILRSMQMMTDNEICMFYYQEEDYIRELILLEALVRHFKIKTEEIFKVSAKDLNNFWKL